MFVNPRPSSDDLLDLKTSLIENANNDLDTDFICYATEPIQESVGLIKKNYPVWLLQQFVILSDMNSETMFGDEEEYYSIGDLEFNSFLTYSHYTLVKSMIKSSSFLDKSIGFYKPFIHLTLEETPKRSLLEGLVIS